MPFTSGIRGLPTILLYSIFGKHQRHSGRIDFCQNLHRTNSSIVIYSVRLFFFTYMHQMERDIRRINIFRGSYYAGKGVRIARPTTLYFGSSTFEPDTYLFVN